MSTDNQEISFIKSTKNHANKVITWLKEINALNQNIKIIAKSELVYIPFLFLPPDWDSISKNFKLEIIGSMSKNHSEWQQLITQIEIRQKKYKKSLKEFLEPFIPFEFIEKVPRSFDIIGDIAIIELNRPDQQEMKPYISLIGQKLLEIHPHLCSVYQKGGDVEGIFRTRKLELIAGKPNTITLYRENNCNFKLDIEKVFFSPRLSFERNRVANLSTSYSKRGFIWDMFCGVGPFFIQIAKKDPKTRFLATDANSMAIDYAKLNISKNKIFNEINLIIQNLDEINNNLNFRLFHKKISRFIMNLPEKSLDYIKILPDFMLQNGSLVHIYQFNEKSDPLKEALDKFQNELQKNHCALKELIFSGIVKPFSPALDMTVIDAVVVKQN